MSRMGAAIWHMISSDPINGAYTELFAGFHSSITKESNWGELDAMDLHE